jgi:hypothetical protein
MNDLKHTTGFWAVAKFDENNEPFAVIPSDTSGTPWVSLTKKISSGDRIICEVRMSTWRLGSIHTVDNVVEFDANVDRICGLANITDGLHIAQVEQAIEAYRATLGGNQ